MKTFCKFVTKGYRYLEQNNKDEGFLHFVIALDLIFGDKEESTKTICNRCAVLTFEQNGNTFEEQKKLLNILYDGRSKYVHAGESVKPHLIQEVKKLCIQILYVLLRLQNIKATPIKLLTIDQWKKQLNYAYTAVEAGQPISDELKRLVGIIE